MTATRGSYSLNCKTSIGTAHYSVICDNPAKISSTQNDNTGTAPGHVTRSATTLNVTSSHGELSATPNGTSNKLSNGQQCSTANGNGIIRSKTQANGRTCSSNGLSSDKRETLGNGSSDIKSSSTPLPSCGHELRSQQLSSARPVTNGSSAQSLTSSHCHRQNGTHNGSSCHVGGNATTEFFASPNSSRRYQGINGQVVEVTSSLAQNGHTSSLETTDIDGLQDIVDHPFFTLADDAGQHDSLQIVSSKGTVRGVRNRVKAGIAVFVEQQGNRKQKDYRSLESGKIVVYTTSVMVVRDTYEKCLRVNKILQTHVVRYEQRDVSLSRDDHRELIERLGPNVDLPQVFADGIHIGDADEIVRLNENGTLRKIFQRFKTVPTLTACVKCGGYRYVPCANCHGSKKSRRNNFTREFCALRCTVCDDNGLVLCDLCTSDEMSSCL